MASPLPEIVQIGSFELCAPILWNYLCSSAQKDTFHFFLVKFSLVNHHCCRLIGSDVVSTKSLVLELEGPGLQPMVLVDLPGIIQVTCSFIILILRQYRFCLIYHYFYHRLQWFLSLLVVVFLLVIVLLLLCYELGYSLNSKNPTKEFLFLLSIVVLTLSFSACIKDY